MELLKGEIGFTMNLLLTSLIGQFQRYFNRSLPVASQLQLAKRMSSTLSRRFPVVVLLSTICAAQSPPVPRISADTVTDHLEQTITWYRHVGALEQSVSAPEDILLLGTTHQAALRTLQLGFDFAHAEVALQAAIRNPSASSTGSAPGAAGSGPAGSASRNIQQVAARAAERVANAQSKLSDLDAAAAAAKPRDRDALLAQRKEMEAQLNLAKEIQKSVENVASFATNAGGSSGPSSGLAGQIAELERTVPESRHAPANAPASSSTSTPAPTAPKQAPLPKPVNRVGSEGLVSLVSDVFSLREDIGEFDSLLGDTDALVKHVDQVRNPLVNSLRDSIRQSDQLADAPQSTDLNEINAHQQQINAFTAQFRQLSTVLIPLGEQQIMAENTRGDLSEWRSTVVEQYHVALHALLVRAGTIAAMVFFILVVSSVWRRAALRYVSDPRRRRQFLLVRRIVVGSAIALVVLLSFVSEFGSFVTYAGFLTAGLALALQNVILSVVAYFFLIGRYGVRVGDRVTIAGVNGEVIDMGLVRMYMMELAGSPTDLHATGRVVVYSNSVLFQPAAIYKQMPGITYAWHSATLTLTPESDFEVAERSLTAAVNSVYEQYRAAIEKQHATLERSVEVQFDTPKPESHLRFNDTGLEFSVRYPVESNRAPEIDARVMQALTDAINKEPKLTLALAGAPKLTPTSDAPSA